VAHNRISIVRPPHWSQGPECTRPALIFSCHQFSSRSGGESRGGGEVLKLGVGKNLEGVCSIGARVVSLIDQYDDNTPV